VNETPIEDYLDELLRRSSTDARATRRLLDEAADHLYATAADLQAAGMAREQAEAEAVHRFGPVPPIMQAQARGSLPALAFETLRAALYLASFALVMVGISGLVALIMNLWAGTAFVGGQAVFPGRGTSVEEVADDAVVLRVVAGIAGLVLLLAYIACGVMPDRHRCFLVAWSMLWARRLSLRGQSAYRSSRSIKPPGQVRPESDSASAAPSRHFRQRSTSVLAPRALC
jgi:hypothetical protein